MERPPKRRRVEAPPHGDHEDEEELHPEVQERIAVRERFKSRLEDIFEKYGKDFTGVGDEIDLITGEIVVDNGHLQHMEDEGDIGDDISEEDEVFSGDERNAKDLETGCSSVQGGPKTSKAKHIDTEHSPDDNLPLETLNHESALARRLWTSASQRATPRPASKDPRWQVPDVPEVEFETTGADHAQIDELDRGDIDDGDPGLRSPILKKAGGLPVKSPGPSLWAQPRRYRKTHARWQKEELEPSQESIWALEDETSDADSLMHVRNGADHVRDTAAANGREISEISSRNLFPPVTKPDVQGSMSSEAPNHDTLPGQATGNVSSQDSAPQRQFSRILSIPDTTQDTSTPVDVLSSVVPRTNPGSHPKDEFRLEHTINHPAHDLPDLNPRLLALSKSLFAEPLPQSSPLSMLQSSDPRMAQPSSMALTRSFQGNPAEQQREPSNDSSSVIEASTSRMFEPKPQQEVKKASSVVSLLGQHSNPQRRRLLRLGATTMHKAFIPVKPSKKTTGPARAALNVHQAQELIERAARIQPESKLSSSLIPLSKAKARELPDHTDHQPLSKSMTIDLTLESDDDRKERETTPIDTYHYILADPWPTKPWRGDRIPGMPNQSAARRGSNASARRSGVSSGASLHSPLLLADDDDTNAVDGQEGPSLVAVVEDTQVPLIEEDSLRDPEDDVLALATDHLGLEESQAVGETPQAGETRTKGSSRHLVEDSPGSPVAESLIANSTNAKAVQESSELYPFPASPGRLLIDGSEESPRKVSPKYRVADIIAEFGRGRPLTKTNLLAQSEIPSTSQESVLSFLNSQATALVSRRTPTPKPMILPQKAHRRSISSANACGVNGVKCNRTFCFNCTSRAATQEDVEF